MNIYSLLMQGAQPKLPPHTSAIKMRQSALVYWEEMQADCAE